MARVTTVDEDQQEVVVDQPSPGEFFGFAPMLAAIQAPVIMMSQNQAQGLARELNLLSDKFEDFEELLRWYFSAHSRMRRASIRQSLGVSFSHAALTFGQTRPA